MKEYEAQVESLTLIPSDGGRFELEVNGKLIYSKIQTKRHMEPGEAVRLIKEFLRS